jgi:hypothetical protein
LPILQTATGRRLTFCLMGKLMATCVLALVFGFGGALGAVAALHDQLQGQQGADGLTGAPGDAGVAGSDGKNGARGAHGVAGTPGKPGKRGKAAPKTAVSATDIGTADCAGRSVEVVTKARLINGKHLVVIKKRICLVSPPTSP